MLLIFSGKSSMRRPPQVIKSSTLPDSYGSGGHRQLKVRGSSEEFRDSMDNTGGKWIGCSQPIGVFYMVLGQRLEASAPPPIWDILVACEAHQGLNLAGHLY